MKTYARVYEGIVMELFSTDGDIGEMFHPDLVWIDVTGTQPQPKEGWTYSEERGFEPPAEDATPVTAIR
ncbi:hypothetical protein [Cupriavidus gilardii]|uniref:hypothetical protein n=1 Tax=Cupriavidus gilardii TaxID=82541 RepID=UPI0009ED7C6F|nr:hypothetical protein [Cupriavidus gilardii]